MRTKEQIDSDMGRLCVQAGDLQYRIEAYKSQLVNLNQEIAKLHQEIHDNQVAAQKMDEYQNSTPVVGGETSGQI